MSSVRVRFAPSPTGVLHIGSARTALFNWLYARHHGGSFILRIDDTDERRSTEASMQAIFDALRWLGLDWDEGPDVGGPYAPYTQSERLERHRAYAQRLLEAGKAYACYCTKDELDAARKQAQARRRPYRYDGRCSRLTDAERATFEAEGRPKTVRLKVEPQRIVVHDLILGDVTFDAESLDDFIIMKPNFTPLYNFSSAVDDEDLKITHVIRGQDHLSNTPRQILICRALGIEPPAFAHIPMVHNMKGQKLSKRDGAVSVIEYREMGYLPEAMVNYLVRLAWSADGVEEVFSVAELIERFSLDRVGKSPSRFDMQKLTWLNAQYLGRKSLAERTDAVLPFLRKAGVDPETMPRSRLERIVAAVGDRLHTLADITTYAGYFFVADDALEFDPAAIKKWFKTDDAVETIRNAAEVLGEVEPFDVETIEAALRAWIERTGRKTIRALQPIRVAVTGKMVGPGLFEVLDLLGKPAVLSRLRRAAREIPLRRG